MYARAVKQKVWNEAENRERDWGETLVFFFFSLNRPRLLGHALPISLLQCTFVSVTCFLNIAVELKHETLDVWIYVYTNLNNNKNFTVLLIQKYFAHTLMTRQSSLRKSSNILGASNAFLVLRGYIWLYNLYSFPVPLSDLLLRSAFPQVWWFLRA